MEAAVKILRLYSMEAGGTYDRLLLEPSGQQRTTEMSAVMGKRPLTDDKLACFERATVAWHPPADRIAPGPGRFVSLINSLSAWAARP